MKIAVIEFAGRGGLLHYAWQLCEAMQLEGAEVTLITDRRYELARLPHAFTVLPVLQLWDPKPASDVRPALRRLRRGWRALRYYGEWHRVIRELRRLQPDVVHLGDIRFASDLVPIRMIRKIARVMGDICHNVRPFSGGAGSSGRFSMSSAERAAYARLYSQFDVIFVHHEINENDFRETFPSSAGKVTRIVHGNEEIFDRLSDKNLDAATLRQDLALVPSTRVILFFGTLTSYKGLDILLAAFSTVAERQSDVTLVVAGFPFGDFDPKTWLAEAARLGLCERVRLVPRYIEDSEVRAFMDLASVAAFPYREIYQSGAIQVALTFGVPVVATRVGAMAEVVRHEVTGLLVEPENPERLATALLRILADPATARSMGAAAAADAQERFSWRGVAREILASYSRLLNEEGR